MIPYSPKVSLVFYFSDDLYLDLKELVADLKNWLPTTSLFLVNHKIKLLGITVGL